MASKEARLTITGWTSIPDREDRVRDIVASLPGARRGETFAYRGLTIEKRDGDSRGHQLVAVLTADGEEIAQVDAGEHEPHELCEMLDEMRQAWVDKRQAGGA